MQELENGKGGKITIHKRRDYSTVSKEHEMTH
jgi:hypothetical protein